MLKKIIKLSTIVLLSFPSTSFAENIERFEPEILPKNLYSEYVLSLIHI